MQERISFTYNIFILLYAKKQQEMIKHSVWQHFLFPDILQFLLHKIAVTMMTFPYHRVKCLRITPPMALEQNLDTMLDEQKDPLPAE